MKRIALIALAAAAVLLLLKSLSPETDRPSSIGTIRGNAMGTTWSLRCKAPKRFHNLITKTLSRYEQLLSHWQTDSEISRLNAGGIAKPSVELEKLLSHATEFKKHTGGAYDHTLLRQTQAAGFAPNLLTNAHSYDLSGLAKGYVIDQLTQQLHAEGIKDFVIELGGECYASGTQANGSPWPVQIPSPVGGEAFIVHLSNQAIATSGNYHQVASIKDGKITSHLIDPSSGKPNTTPARSVSIIAADCITADAYATAMFINPDLTLPDDYESITLPKIKP
jgi:thiamine biosynthesis lipoprotein